MAAAAAIATPLVDHGLNWQMLSQNMGDRVIVDLVSCWPLEMPAHFLYLRVDKFKLLFLNQSIGGENEVQCDGYPVLRFKNAKVFWLNSLTFS